MRKVLIIGVISLLLAACDTFWPRDNIENYDVADETELTIAEQLELIVNPEFYSIGDVLDYRYKVCEEASIDSMFISMPEETLKNVASVILNKGLPCTKRSIVQEYITCHAVYDNLPKTQNDVDLGATDLGNKQENGNYELASTEYEYFTDSTTGKNIQVKKEKYVGK